MASAGVLPVALYDKAGLILAQQDGIVCLAGPSSQSAGGSLRLFGTQHQLDFYCPVYADPGNEFLLGYLAMKFDFMAELQQAHSFRYADLRNLKVKLSSNSLIDVGHSLKLLTFSVLPNDNLDQYLHLFEDAQLRLTLIVLAALLLAAWLLWASGGLSVADLFPENQCDANHWRQPAKRDALNSIRLCSSPNWKTRVAHSANTRNACRRCMKTWSRTTAISSIRPDTTRAHGHFQPTRL